MDLNLKGKVALVTGGSHGIGQAIAVSLAQEGCNIAFCARGERYDMHTTSELVWNRGVGCLPMEINTDSEENAKLVVKKTISHFGGIDILINNVGGGSSWGIIERWEDTPTGVWEEVMTHNYFTTLWFTNAVIPQMKEKRFGRVVSISAIYGKERGGQPWFHAAKAAQIALMKDYSGNPAFVQNGITFNTVCPGYTNVGKTMIQGDAEIPMGRYGDVDEIAPIVTLLCSKKGAYINGATIVVDGGLSKSI